MALTKSCSPSCLCLTLIWFPDGWWQGVFYNQRAGPAGEGAPEPLGSRGAFAAAVMQLFVTAWLKRLLMVQATRHVLNLSNKCFISISLTLWIYEPHYLSLLVLQGIKIVTVYSPSHPGCSVSICHHYSPESYSAAFNSPSSQWHPWLYSALTVKLWLSRWRKESTNRLLLWKCFLNYRYSVLSLGTCTILEIFFNSATLISKVIFCFQKAKKREEKKKINCFIFTYIFLLSVRTKE